jgi:hypothetical protein
MRNYVKRTAVNPMDVINIMNPIYLPPNQRGSYNMPMRAPSAESTRIGYDVYHEEKEEITGTAERTMGVSTFVRNSRQTSLINVSFLGSRDQGRQDNPIRLITLR